MAQGAIKKSAKPSTKATHPKRGARVVKPQKAKSTKSDKVVKKFTSGLIGKTEAMLGERAGHLELIGKGKKGPKTEKKKGGSRKFG